MKKFLTLLLSFCFMLTLIIPAQVKAETKLKLNKTKVTMDVDTTFKLKLGNLKGNKSKWYSTNKEVATVSKWGTITAKSEGTTTIRVRYDNKLYKCSVTVNKVIPSKLTLEWDSKEVKYLTSGVDFTPGTYDITCLKGKAQMVIYTSQEMVGVDYKIFGMLVDENTTLNENYAGTLRLTTYTKVKLDEGYVIRLDDSGYFKIQFSLSE